MKRLVLAPILTLALACGDDGVLQPDAAAPDVIAAAAMPVTPANGGIVVSFVATYVGPLDAGQSRLTPGGVLLTKGIWNEFVLTGDIEGREYWYGKLNLNLGQVKGPTVGESALFELTSLHGQPVSGGFECRGNGVIEDYPGPDATYEGFAFACKGFGDFENKHMRGSFNFRPADVAYDCSAVIW